MRVTLKAILMAMVVMMAAALIAPQTRAQGLAESRFFPETGFSVSDDGIWEYMQVRGGIESFGFPISETFVFRGFPVQIFQRHVIQNVNGVVRPINLLDPSLLPLERLNGSTFPAYEPGLAAAAPPPDASNYGIAVFEHMDRVVPDVWEGEEVGFARYWFSSAPRNTDGFAALLALEVWGFPTSAPARDPNNGNFIYQRFQRGIMHYDATTGVTRGILLGSAFKSVLTGVDMPPDLARDMQNSPFLRLYDEDLYNALAREETNISPPITYENTDMRGAFLNASAPPVYDVAQLTMVDYQRSDPATCQPVMIPLVVPIERTTSPLAASLGNLARVNLDEYDPQSNLYNPAGTIGLRFISVGVQDGVATVNYSGTITPLLRCDPYWFELQVVETAQAFSSVDSVEIFIDGQPFADLVPELRLPDDPQPPVFTSVDLFLVALEDGGQNGIGIGCGDSLVRVSRAVAPTTTPLYTTIESLLELGGPVVQPEGLYNSFHAFDLMIQQISLENGVATIELVGEFGVGGVCEEPRITEQIRQSALQFATVDEVILLINGRPFPDR